MCDVPSIAVFCSESMERFPGTTSKFFLKLLVTTPVAPIITGIIVHLLLLLLLLLLLVSNFEEPLKVSEDETLTATEYKFKALPPYPPVHFGLTKALRKPHIRTQK